MELNKQQHELVKTSIAQLCRGMQWYEKNCTPEDLARVMKEELVVLEKHLEEDGVFVQFALESIEPGNTGYAGLITYGPRTPAEKDPRIERLLAVGRQFLAQPRPPVEKEDEKCCEGTTLTVKDTEVCIPKPQDEVIINGIIPDSITVTHVQKVPGEVVFFVPNDLGTVHEHTYTLLPKGSVLSAFVRTLARVDRQTNHVAKFRETLIGNLSTAMRETLKQFFGPECMADEFWEKVERENSQNS